MMTEPTTAEAEAEATATETREEKKRRAAAIAAEEAVAEAQALRTEGNAHYARREYDAAAALYTRAIDAVRPHFREDGGSTTTTEESEAKAKGEYVTLCSNRAACSLSQQKYAIAEADCTRALAHSPAHAKALWRRADAREALGRAREALDDLRALARADAEIGRCAQVAQAVARLEPAAKAQQDAEMAEMLGKLKGLGNALLGRFGLSTDNFKVHKDPATGGYSIRFDQGQQQQQQTSSQQQQQGEERRSSSSSTAEDEEEEEEPSSQ